MHNIFLPYFKTLKSWRPFGLLEESKIYSVSIILEQIIMEMYLNVKYQASKCLRTCAHDFYSL
jgi:hypothetical protein